MKKVIIYLLNINDLICTLYLLSKGVEEANPLMVYIASSPVLAIFIKVIVVGILLIFMSRYMKKDHKVAGFALNALLCAYIYVTFVHIYCILHI